MSGLKAAVLATVGAAAIAVGFLVASQVRDEPPPTPAPAPPMIAPLEDYIPATDTEAAQMKYPGLSLEKVIIP